MTTVTAEAVARAVREAIPHLACELPEDVARALAAARDAEDAPLGRFVLDELVENERIAREDRVPICQDTGTVWVRLDVGPDVEIAGDVLSGVDDAVAKAYEEARLRRSVVRDALVDRTNTGDNTPAFAEVCFVDEPGARLHIMLKGGGSDNASRVVMLTPGAGRAAIVDEVVRCVREKGPNACPPLVIGVGVGATFDKVGGLAKHALMRKVGEPSPDAETAAFERELLDAVNATGVGAGGLGGAAAALAVHVETAPCHIAALPLAINMGCSALRRATVPLAPANGEEAPRFAGEPACAGGAGAPAPASLPADPVSLALPLDRAELAKLKAGDVCELTGPLFTLRDAGHIRLLDELAVSEEAGEGLPYGLSGQTIFYAGPTPAAAGRPFGAVGPTTASRMDFAAPALYRAGIVATVGKGARSEDVRRACVETGSVYFAAVGGAAAFLAERVRSSQTVSYDDLGTEALRRIEVERFPVVVAIDAHGESVFDRA